MHDERSGAVTDSKVPDQKELEKELSDYLSKKYGDRIKIVSPVMVPREETSGEGSQSGGRKKTSENVAFGMKPEELESFLDEYVVRQDVAKSILATKICTHFNRIRFSRNMKRRGGQELVGQIKNNIILVGPTGVGKTYIIKLIAQKIGVPFVKGDATKFSETGYVGGDVEDLVRDLLYDAADDIELAQYGIIYIDEIDKIASSHSLIGPDVSRSGVQRALLKLMEETEVDLKVPHDPISQIQAIENYRKTGKREKRTVNTRDILFIVSGAFTGIDKMIRERTSKARIGFGGEVEGKEIPSEILREIKTEDFINYGFESEFIGRLPVVAVFDELSVEDLYQILRNPNNPVITSKKRDFRSYGIEVRFEDEALRLLAQQAQIEKTGARGLVSVVEKALIPFEKKLPSTSVSRLLVTPELVRDPATELKRILEEGGARDTDARFAAAVSSDRKSLQELLRAKKEEELRRYGLDLSADIVDMVHEFHVQLGMDMSRALEEIYTMGLQVKTYEKTFLQKYGLSVQFEDEAVLEIMKRSLESGDGATEVCELLAREFEYGLRLIKERTGKNDFILSREAVLQPEAFLNELIKQHFSEQGARQEIRESMTRSRQEES